VHITEFKLLVFGQTQQKTDIRIQPDDLAKDVTTSIFHIIQIGLLCPPTGI